jgi:hypothetical protein
VSNQKIAVYLDAWVPVVVCVVCCVAEKVIPLEVVRNDRRSGLVAPELPPEDLVVTGWRLPAGWGEFYPDPNALPWPGPDTTSHLCAECLGWVRKGVWAIYVMLANAARRSVPTADDFEAAVEALARREGIVRSEIAGEKSRQRRGSA